MIGEPHDFNDLETNTAWPAEILPVVQRSLTVEYASLQRDGMPLTVPVTPYVGEDGRTLDVSTGLAYAAKAERARRNPHVALLYSNSTGSGLANPPTVLVFGHATVRDADLQANTDRYIRLSMTKFPATYATTPRFLLRRMSWYFARIWIKVTPLRILWWPGGDLAQAPQQWEAPASTQAPPSDPPPQGKGLGSWKEGPVDWRADAAHAVAQMGMPVLTVREEMYPVPLRVRTVSLAAEGFQLERYESTPSLVLGPASLTFHWHDEQFTQQQNLTFVGALSGDPLRPQLRVERRIADWSIRGSQLVRTLSFFAKGRRLAPRLQTEAARRRQPVPVVNLP